MKYILHMIYSNEFCWKEMFCILIQIILKFIAEGPIKVIQYWFRQWLGVEQVTMTWINDDIIPWHMYASQALKELNKAGACTGISSLMY